MAAEAHDWREGLRRSGLHFVGFGLYFGLLVLYGGWSGAVVLVIWRAYAEYLDWRDGHDTPGKAVIDFTSQVAVAVIAAWLRPKLSR